MADLFYAVDGVMLLLAAGATACAVAEMRQRVVKRWMVLATGVLAALAAIALLSYPDVRDLLQLEVWSVAAVGILAGFARPVHGHGRRPQLAPGAPHLGA